MTGYRLYFKGARIGDFPTEDAAMNAAQDKGLVVPAAEDEGGPQYGVLHPSATIMQLGLDLVVRNG